LIWIKTSETKADGKRVKQSKARDPKVSIDDNETLLSPINEDKMIKLELEKSKGYGTQ
jgi:hypothetical protein